MKYAIAYIYFFGEKAYANFSGEEGRRDFIVENYFDVPPQRTFGLVSYDEATKTANFIPYDSIKRVYVNNNTEYVPDGYLFADAAIVFYDKARKDAVAVFNEKAGYHELNIENPKELPEDPKTGFVIYMKKSRFCRYIDTKIISKVELKQGVCPCCKKVGVLEDGCPTCPGFWYTDKKQELERV